jgi:photosystem II stability/assembly factor-like uncharacterized protein
MAGIPFWRISTILTVGHSIWLAGLPGGVVRSTNGGQHWLHSGIDQVEAPIISLVASPNYRRDRVLLAGTDGDGVLRSTNGGQYWELANFGLADFAIFELATAPQWDKYEYVFALTDGGVYQSPNGGRAWRQADLAGQVVEPVALTVSPTFSQDQTVVIGCAGGEVLVSTDAGRSYHLATAAFAAISAIAFSPVGTLLLGTPEGVYRLEEAGDGAIPGPAAALLSSLPAPVLALNSSGDRLYAALVDGGQFSEDDGRSWQPLAGLAARRFLWLLTPRSDFWLAAGPEEGLWRSGDGGQSWRAIWVETPVLALTARADQVWLGLTGGVVTSTDAGTTWQTVLPGEQPVVGLAVVEDTVWAGSQDGRLWCSGPGGSWQAVEVPFAGGQLLGLMGHGRTLLAAVWEERAKWGEVRIWRSDDGGAGWSLWFSQASQRQTPHLALLDEAGDEALVGLGPDLYRTAASGWQRQRLTSAAAPITALLGQGDQVLVAVTDRLVASDEAGQWLPRYPELNGQSVAALSQDRDELVLLTSDGQVWKIINGARGAG